MTDAEIVEAARARVQSAYDSLPLKSNMQLTGDIGLIEGLLNITEKLAQHIQKTQGHLLPPHLRTANLSSGFNHAGKDTQ